jgi:starvation-inducible DNA-binding protein
MDGEIWQWDGPHSIDPIVTHRALQIEEKEHVCHAVTPLLANLFSLFITTKVFQWHAAGSGFSSHYLLLFDQADQILATSDTIGERVRALGGNPIRSIDEVSRLHRSSDSASADLTSREMLAALLHDTRLVAKQMRRTCTLCRGHGPRSCSRMGLTR